MFETFRERLHIVQQDFSSSLKNLGDATKDPKIRRKSRFEESPPRLNAGLEILSRYEESWFLLHKGTKDCAEAAEAADGDVVMLSAHWERRRAALNQLHEQLQNLPDFIGQLDAITANIAHLEGDFEEMESRLVYLETLCSQCDQLGLKKQHMNQLESYRKKKRKELELLEVELNSEHAQKVAELEQAVQHKLRERQKVYEEAFNQDVEQYLSTGQLQQRAASAAVCDLEQVTVANVSDQEALDDFLNSSTEDFSTGSSLTSGPDLSSPFSPTPPTSAQPSNQQQEEAAGSEESEGSLVQSDEDDVQADMELVGDWPSDESDTAVGGPSTL